MQPYRTVAATDGNRHFEITLPDDLPPERLQVGVVVKVIESASAVDELQALFDWLETLPPSGRSAQDVEARIAEERNAWGDDDRCASPRTLAW